MELPSSLDLATDPIGFPVGSERAVFSSPRRFKIARYQDVDVN